VNVDGDAVAVGGDLQKGQVRPGCGFGNVVAPGFDGVHQSAGRVAEVVRKTSKYEAFERVETILVVTKPRASRPMGRCKGMLDHGLAKLRAVDRSTTHQTEQVAESVGAALALTATVDYEFVVHAQSACERFERRLQLA
jgi:hypothetical protein